MIHHSAKDVIYDSANFVERNSDSISLSLVHLLIEKTDKTIGTIYSEKVSEAKTKEQPNFKTIWEKFKY